MIAVLDTETLGLNATRKAYVIGAILDETGKYFETTNPEILWNYIIELGEKQRKTGKNLIIYAHNARYDYNTIADKEDKECKQYSTNPFILDRKNIKFTDSLAIFKRLSLEEIGKITGNQKKETPQCLKEARKPTTEEMKIIKEYLKQDCETLMYAIKLTKEKLKEEKVLPRMLITIGQVGKNYFIKRTNPERTRGIFHKGMKQEGLTRTKYKEETHAAYRGGRVQALKYGKIENATIIDINSLYPYAATKIRFPNLETEIKIETPPKELIKEIGISHVRIKTPNEDKIPLIPIRIKGENEYPGKNKTLIGTWTNRELKKAEEEGYEIEEIYWTIIWEETENPFKEIIKELYEKRKKAKNDFESYFYKNIMNNMIGKFAQRNAIREEIIDSVERMQEYKDKGYEINPEIDLETQYLYQKTIGYEYPKWYAPIIPALITAEARIILYEHMKKINKEDIYYTDTDSIMMKHSKQNIETFKYSNILGDFKIQAENKEAYIYGKKAYSIGEEIKLSGASKKELNKEDFLKGKVKYKRMRSKKGKNEGEEIGTFEEIEADITETTKEHQRKQKEIEEEDFFIDDKTEKYY